LGVGENSVLSTDDITIELRQEPWETGQLNLWVGSPYSRLDRKYFIQICNKTDQTVYLDLGNTFRVMKDGSSKVYFDNSQTTINKGSGSGGSVNLGAIGSAVGLGGALGTLANGVNVGGGTSNSVSKVYARQQIVIIPPRGIVPLEKYQIEWVSKTKSELILSGEELFCAYRKGEFPKINWGEKCFYKENDSPWHADYVITYSKDADFSTSYAVKVSVYMRELIGGDADYDFSLNEGVNTQKLYDKMKERIPEYNIYCIVGSCK